MGDLRKRIERYVETPRVVTCGTRAASDRLGWLPKQKGFPSTKAFNRAEAFLDPVPVPGIHRFLVMAKLGAEIFQYRQIVYRVDVTGHDGSDGTHAARCTGSTGRSGFSG